MLNFAFHAHFDMLVSNLMTVFVHVLVLVPLLIVVENCY